MLQVVPSPGQAAASGSLSPGSQSHIAAISFHRDSQPTWLAQLNPFEAEFKIDFSSPDSSSTTLLLAQQSSQGAVEQGSSQAKEPGSNSVLQHWRHGWQGSPAKDDGWQGAVGTMPLGDVACSAYMSNSFRQQDWLSLSSNGGLLSQFSMSQLQVPGCGCFRWHGSPPYASLTNTWPVHTTPSPFSAISFQPTLRLRHAVCAPVAPAASFRDRAAEEPCTDSRQHDEQQACPATARILSSRTPPTLLCRTLGYSTHGAGSEGMTSFISEQAIENLSSSERAFASASINEEAVGSRGTQPQVKAGLQAAGQGASESYGTGEVATQHLLHGVIQQRAIILAAAVNLDMEYHRTFLTIQPLNQLYRLLSNPSIRISALQIYKLLSSGFAAFRVLAAGAWKYVLAALTKAGGWLPVLKLQPLLLFLKGVGIKVLGGFALAGSATAGLLVFIKLQGAIVAALIVKAVAVVVQFLTGYNMIGAAKVLAVKASMGAVDMGRRLVGSVGLVGGRQRGAGQLKKD